MDDKNYLGAQEFLQYSIALGSLETVKQIIDLNPDLINTTDNSGKTALCLAIEKGHDDIALQLIQAGANPSIGVAQGLPPIHVAAQKGNAKVVEALVEKDATLLNALDKFSQTPLIFAAANGHTEIVKYLLNQKANVTAATNNRGRKYRGMTALGWAIENGHKDTAAELIKSGANPYIGSTQGLLLQKKGSLKVVRLTPLMYAAANGHTEIVKYLLSKNADVNATMKGGGVHHGKTALYWAMTNKDPATRQATTIELIKATLLTKDAEKMLKIPYLKAHLNMMALFEVYKYNLNLQKEIKSFSYQEIVQPAKSKFLSFFQNISPVDLSQRSLDKKTKQDLVNKIIERLEDPKKNNDPVNLSKQEWNALQDGRLKVTYDKLVKLQLITPFQPPASKELEKSSENRSGTPPKI